jgi:hypothetical protein
LNEKNKHEIFFTVNYETFTNEHWNHWSENKIQCIQDLEKFHLWKKAFATVQLLSFLMNGKSGKQDQNV